LLRLKKIDKPRRRLLSRPRNPRLERKISQRDPPPIRDSKMDSRNPSKMPKISSLKKRDKVTMFLVKLTRRTMNEHYIDDFNEFIKIMIKADDP